MGDWRQNFTSDLFVTAATLPALSRRTWPRHPQGSASDYCWGNAPQPACELKIRDLDERIKQTHNPLVSEDWRRAVATAFPSF